MRYNNEQTKDLIDSYNAGTSVSDLAKRYSTTERSVIAKLSIEGVYKKKTYVTKTGELPVKKEVYVERIAELLGKDVLLCESLEKVNKIVLKWLVEALEK